MTNGFERVICGMAILLVCAAFVVRWHAAFVGIPILDGDATFFSPCIHNLAKGKGFTHPFVEVIANNPLKLCIWHGWLYPYLAALLPWSASYELINVSNLFLGYICFALAMSALYRVSERDWKATTALGLPLALLMLHQVGRPELIVTGLVAGVVLALSVSMRDNLRSIIWGILLGLTGTASPSAGVSYAIVTLLVSVLKSSTYKDFLRESISVGAIAFTTLLVVTASFAPVKLSVWLHGIFTNAQTQYISRSGTSDILKYYILNPSFPFLALYLVVGSLVLYDCWRRASDWKKTACLGLSAAIVVYVYYMAVRLPEANYNFALLVPAILFASAHIIARKTLYSKPMRRASLGLGAFGAVALTYVSMTTLISLEGTTEQRFTSGMKFLQSRTGRVQTAQAFAVPLAEVIGYDRVSINLSSSNVAYIVAKQANSSASMPARIPGFRVLIDRFDHKPPSFLGFKIANTRRDWSYAIYCRVGNCFEN